jgi:Ras GTPase-activating-like protein IQGAP2/3
VADVEPLEGYFQAHAMLESTLEAKPISITRNEIYGMLSILMRHVPIIVSLSL